MIDRYPEDFSTVRKCRTFWDIEDFCRRNAWVEMASKLRADILERAFHAQQERSVLRSKVSSQAELEDYADSICAIFESSMGAPVSPELPVEAHITGTLRKRGFRIEKIVLYPRKNMPATGNLYIPDGLESPAPAVLVLHGHDDDGKANRDYQYLDQSLVHAGFVVFALDPYGQGERLEHFESELGINVVHGCSGEHDLMAWKSFLLGISFARFFVQDGLAALAYLESRSEVDSHKIAVTGNSGGGTQTAMMMMAAGDRLAAAAPCSFMTDKRAMLMESIDDDNEMIWNGFMASGADYVDYILAMRGKPVMLLTNRYDFFPKEGTDRTFALAKRILEQAGSSPASVEIAVSETGHRYAPSLAKDATVFFAKHLQGRELVQWEFPFELIPEEELFCTPEGQILKAYPKMKTFQQELARICEENRDRRRQDKFAEEKAFDWLRKRVVWDREFDSLNIRRAGQLLCFTILCEKVIWRSCKETFCAGLLLEDLRFGRNQKETVIALWRDGLRSIVNHENWIRQTLAQGKQVFIIDVTGVGCNTPNMVEEQPLHNGWSTYYRLATYLIELGDSLPAMRLFDILRAADVVEEYHGENCAVTFYGEEEFARYAKMAAFLLRKKAWTAGIENTYSSIVEQDYYSNAYFEDMLLPGVLQYFDMDELTEWLRKDGLME